MIGPVLRVSWLALLRDRWALVLSFIVPVAFFSILALVFGGTGRASLPPVRVAVIDVDASEASGLLVRALAGEPALRVERAVVAAGSTAGETARRLVRRGDVPAALVVPAGFGARFDAFPAETLAIELYDDRTADPVAHHLVGGLLQRAVVGAAPDRLLRGVVAWVEEESDPLTPAQRALVEDVARSVTPSGDGEAASPFRIEAIDVQAVAGRQGRNVVSYYAASIGVMFLLFTMTTAMRGLIAEAETGTLERLLATDLTMGRLLVGRWLFATALGCVQLAVMFVWGWAVFGIDLFGHGHLPGVVVMTIVAAGAAAMLGLVLGAACRTQGQLQGLATVAILLMSALGGSMVPRFLMPDAMQRLGLITFNAWAVIGYEKVFWRDAPVTALWPELAVLGGMTVLGAAAARWLARRWESV